LKISLYFKISELTHKIANKNAMLPKCFQELLQPVSSVHKYNTRYAAKSNFHVPKIGTNYGKFTFRYSATRIWEQIPEKD